MARRYIATMGFRWVAVVAWVAAAAFAATGTAGCSPQSAIDDGVYVSTPESTFPLVAGSSVRMRIVEGRLSLNAGCNTFNGAYSVIDEQRLRVPTLASTQIGCPTALADQDQALERFLTGTPRFARSTDGFTLTDDAGATLWMVDSGEAPAQL